ncbi:MAG: PAS domain S-box protein [Burkholderiales bacterium]|nr:PAS domain S-box protein [Bacteroidia bacterium]
MKSKAKNKILSAKPVMGPKIGPEDDAVLIKVLESFPVGLVVFTLKNILFLNTEAIKIFKPSKQLQKSITNHSVFEFLLPEYHKRIKENVKRIIKGEKFVAFELKIKNAKNEIVDLEVKSSAIAFNGLQAIQTIFTDISKQVKYREELSAAKQNLELITENANDLIYFYTYHPQPKYIYISPSIRKILGYSPEDFYKNGNIGNSIVTDIKAYTTFDTSISKRQKNNTLKHTSAIFQYKTKSGKLIWLEDSYSPIYDDEGKIKFILVISRDITKEKIAQIELEQKWNNYKNLLDTSPIGIFIHESICIYSNKTAANILEEKNPKKLIGKNLIDFLVPEQRQRAIDRMQRAIKGEELMDLSYQIKTVKGKIIDIELKTVPFVYNGKPCVQTTITNISAEKALSKEKLRAEIAEEANKSLTKEINFRQKIQHELMTQTVKYEAMFNSTSLLIWTIDKELRITSFNQNYCDYIKSNYNHSLKIGQNISEIKSKPQSIVKLDIWIKKYKDFFKNKKDNKAEFFEIKNTNIKGETYYREIYLHPIRSADGKTLEIAVIGQDITERRLSEQKILEQSAKLQAIFESGKQLIWTVDKNYFFTSFNQNFSDAMYNIYKVRPTLELKIYKPHKTKKGIEYHNWWLKKYTEVFETGNGIEFTTEQLDSKQTKIFRQIFLHPIVRNGIVKEVSCISNDVTELKYLQGESINQAAKLTSIFESSSHLIWTVDKDFKATSFNKNFSKSFELYNGFEPQLNIQLHTLLSKRRQADYKSYWYSIYKKVFLGNSLKLERKQVEPNGALNYKEIYLNPVRNADNEIIEIACLAHDITENKKFELRIIDQSAKLKAIFESGDHLIWTVNKKFELTSYNRNYFNLIKNNLSKKNLDEGKVISVFDTIQDKSKKLFWTNMYNLVLKGKPHVFVHKSIINNDEVYREIYLYPIFLHNEVVEVSVIAQNITDRIESQNKILEQSAKLKAIFESGDQLMWTITKDFKLTSFNQNYANAIYDLYGYSPEVGKTMRSQKSAEFHMIWDEKYEMAFQGKQAEFVSERTKSNGEKIIRQIILYPIKDDKNNVLEISGIGFDITENKKNEEKITQSLKEKDILLKEVHHRVKNNMQVISSILNLQSSYVKDTYALNLLKECQNRIKSMAFIHESLYQTKNFESVNFAEYVTTLAKNLVHTYSINTKKIKLILTLDKLFLNLDVSIPCGLIINEIISNSLKYAFPDNRDGIIFVTLRVIKNRVSIQVGDNGVGIPESVDIKNTQTLGLQLVDTLVEQINGTLDLKIKNGTTFIIEFKI